MKGREGVLWLWFCLRQDTDPSLDQIRCDVNSMNETSGHLFVNNHRQACNDPEVELSPFPSATVPAKIPPYFYLHQDGSPCLSPITVANGEIFYFFIFCRPDVIQAIQQKQRSACQFQFTQLSCLAQPFYLSPLPKSSFTQQCRGSCPPPTLLFRLKRRKMCTSLFSPNKLQRFYQTDKHFLPVFGLARKNGCSCF